MAMLAVERRGDTGVLLVFLHWLGGGAQSWYETADALAARGFRTALLDLPGFGAAGDDRRWTVEEMRGAVIECLADIRRGEEDAPFVLVGHSMGGKVATVVAATAPPELLGLVLVSGSPPSPEPIDEDVRTRLIERFEPDRFLDDNIAEPLPPPVRARTLAGFATMSKPSFDHWLSSGSREDWSARVGILPLHALLICGSEEPKLGEDNQRGLVAPHFVSHELVVLEATGHLTPLERPERLATLIASYTSSEHASARFRQVLASPRTPEKTRAVMTARLSPPSKTFLDDAARDALEALVEHVLPSAPAMLAASIEAKWAANEPDGHRDGELPSDIEAWKEGLARVDLIAKREYGRTFPALPDTKRALVLATLKKEAPVFLSNLRAELVKAYVSDPRTMSRLGFLGFAREPNGFTKIRIGEKEEFE